MPEMSITCSATDMRRFIIGMSDWPPAISFARAVVAAGELDGLSDAFGAVIRQRCSFHAVPVRVFLTRQIRLRRARA